MRVFSLPCFCAFMLAYQLCIGGALAATLDISSGQLLGASNVDVAGGLYNVEFLDGTCADVFAGCDELSDFAFGGDLDMARIAGEALLNQVFVDTYFGEFDSYPFLTNGCTADFFWCLSLIPFRLPGETSPNPTVLPANNVSSTAPLGQEDELVSPYTVVNTPLEQTIPPSIRANFSTYARFEVVSLPPEVVSLPPTAWLLMTSLVGTVCLIRYRGSSN
jgi:hypothetical protein